MRISFKRLWSDRMKAATVTLLGVMAILALFLRNHASLHNYYKDTENYVTVTDAVYHIQYNEKQDKQYLAFEEIPDGFSERDFYLVGECLQIARREGIDEALDLGDDITLICAPGYFWDGYTVPVAAIQVDGKWFLEFEEGHAALLDWLKEN